MKTAWLLHGTGGNDDDYFWFGDTAQFLATQGYRVWWPQLPHTEKPELVETRNFIEGHHNLSHWNEDMIIIGHSSACPVILHMLQFFKIQIRQVILIAGFYQSIDDDGYLDRMLPKDGFDFEEIRRHAKEIIFINSDNDPWGCTDEQARPIAIKLNAPLIVMSGQGHMGSNAFKQPYREFPLVKRLVRAE